MRRLFAHFIVFATIISLASLKHDPSDLAWLLVAIALYISKYTEEK